MGIDHRRIESLLRDSGAFTRDDETDDALFYARDRIVQHLDARALATVESLIGTLVVEPRPAILDLMASWDSHLPASLEPAECVGLGLNQNELERNAALTGRVLHDLNATPALPFESGRFDVVLNTVSVDYMTRPFDVFREAGRVLRPGGLFLVIFSDRMFPEKAVKVWRTASDAERVILVADFFEASGLFQEPRIFVSKGRPRPADDRYAPLGIPSDPIYAVYADRLGAAADRPARPVPRAELSKPLREEELLLRSALVRTTLRCPHCEQPMKKWRVPDSPFATWPNEFMYICFNDSCPYLLRGWEVMADQGNVGLSYRQMYNPDTGKLLAVPVPTLRALRDSIVEE
jgi:SAM-dependent methyltransferase